MDRLPPVGWLSAAALHGAAHQAPQTFQVAVDRQVRNREVGSTKFAFAQRDIARIPVESRQTRSGTAYISTIAATMFDIAADMKRAGGIDNATTVICELSELDGFSMHELASLVEIFPVAAARRIGWMLDRFTDHENLAPLHATISQSSVAPSRLEAAGDPVRPIDECWMLHVNREVEPD